MQDKDANIHVIRTVWRRTKKGHIKVRDLQPEKDVKGGGSVAGVIGTSSSITDAQLSIRRNRLTAPHHPPRLSWLHRLRTAPEGFIRRLFEIPAEPERKAHAERIAKAQRLFLRWLKKGNR
jgi:hypothetical protein